MGCCRAELTWGGGYTISQFTQRGCWALLGHAGCSKQRVFQMEDRAAQVPSGTTIAHVHTQVRSSLTKEGQP